MAERGVFGPVAQRNRAYLQLEQRNSLPLAVSTPSPQFGHRPTAFAPTRSPFASTARRSQRSSSSSRSTLASSSRIRLTRRRAVRPRIGSVVMLSHDRRYAARRPNRCSTCHLPRRSLPGERVPSPRESEAVASGAVARVRCPGRDGSLARRKAFGTSQRTTVGMHRDDRPARPDRRTARFDRATASFDRPTASFDRRPVSPDRRGTRGGRR